MMVTSDQAVAEALDETVQAITVLDLNRLKTLEEKISVLAQYSITWGKGGINAMLAKKHLLDLILRNCEANLDSLKQLNGRDTRDQWAH
jgi:hypothetical protein